MIEWIYQVWKKLTIHGLKERLLDCLLHCLIDEVWYNYHSLVNQ